MGSKLCLSESRFTGKSGFSAPLTCKGHKNLVTLNDTKSVSMKGYQTKKLPDPDALGDARRGMILQKTEVTGLKDDIGKVKT